jgi:hypothetical protein
MDAASLGGAATGMTEALAILFAAAPFMFGLIRLIAASDYRMLAMAVVAFIGVMVVRMMKRDVPPSTAAIFFVGTVLAAIVAYIMGARAAFGIWPVAIVFGFCYAASNVLKSHKPKPV